MNGERVGIAAEILAHRRHHVEQPVMREDRGVRRLYAFQERGAALPFAWEINTAVERHLSRFRALRDHPQLPIGLDQEGVGKMPGLLDDREDFADGSVGAK